MNFGFKMRVEGGVVVSSYSTTIRGLVPHSLGLHEWHIKSQVKYLSDRIWFSLTKHIGL